MAKQTVLTGLPYPSEGDDPWWTVWESFMAALDAGLHAAWEDSGLTLFTAGYLLYKPTGSTLTWSAEIAIYDPRTGFRVKVAAGSVAMTSGQVAYVAIPRNMAADTVGTVVAASSLPSDADSFPLAILPQIGTVYACVFRDGTLLADGVPFWPTLKMLEMQKLLDGSGPSPVVAAQFADADFFGFELHYSIQRMSGTTVTGRIGRVRVIRDADGAQQTVNDDFTDSPGGAPGITFTATASGGTFGLSYTATSTGADGVLIAHSLKAYPLLGGLIPIGAGGTGQAMQG